MKSREVTIKQEYGKFQCEVNDWLCPHCGDLLAKDGKEEPEMCRHEWHEENERVFFCGCGETGGHTSGVRAWTWAYKDKRLEEVLA